MIAGREGMRRKNERPGGIFHLRKGRPGGSGPPSSAYRFSPSLEFPIFSDFSDSLEFFWDFSGRCG